MKPLTVVTSIFLVFFSLSVSAQGDRIIMTIGDDEVTVSDFESIFRKNNRDTVTTVQSLDEYMELFINFKLKVEEAKSLGMDTVSSFINELAGYRKQLARPYLTDTEMLNQLIAEAYERKKTEVRASHILIKCEDKASPKDTLAAWNSINKVRNGILNGDDFAAVAKKVSDDPSAKDNAGDLGYFSAFQMVYPFEEAAFNTPTGEVSQPVRTRFGYHILYVTDKRPARGEIHAAHIMVKPKKTNDPTEIKKAKDKIFDIYAQLQQGANFAEMAVKYSEDGSTSRKGGELPWFGTGKMVSQFEDHAFAMKKDGDYSEPFETEYGWHIVKRLEYRPIASFEEMRKELKSKVSRDTRAEKTKKAFVENLKVEYHLDVNDKIQKKILKTIDTTTNTVILPEKLKTKTFLTLNDEEFYAQDWISILEQKITKRKGRNVSSVFDSAWKEYLEKFLLDYEDARLEQKHDAFRLLMNEYCDGILLFELTDQKVWSKAVKDSVGLAEFYENHKNMFMWNERIDATIYTCKDKNAESQLEKMLKKGKTQEEITTHINKESQLNLQVKSGQYLKEDEPVLDMIDWELGLQGPIQLNGQLVLVDIQEIIPSQPKKLDEAKGLVTAEYQNYLEKEWIKELRTKHPYQVNTDVLHSLATE